MTQNNDVQKLSYSEQMRIALLKKNGGEKSGGGTSKNGASKSFKPNAQAPKSKGGTTQKSQRGV